MLIVRKYTHIYAEKQGKENKIGTEMIKKKEIQGDFGILRTVSFRMHERDRVVNDCHFLSGNIVAVHGKLLINFYSTYILTLWECKRRSCIMMLSHIMFHVTWHYYLLFHI